MNSMSISKLQAYHTSTCCSCNILFLLLKFCSYLSAMRFLKIIFRLSEYTVKDSNSVLSTTHMYAMYMAFTKAFGVGHKFDQKKMGIIIKWLFDHPPLIPRVLSGQKHSCYIGLHMRSVEERSKSGPVINIPVWVNRVLPEHEIHGYQFTTLYLMDGVNQYVQVYISEETGYYHILFRGSKSS